MREYQWLLQGFAGCLVVASAGCTTTHGGDDDGGGSGAGTQIQIQSDAAFVAFQDGANAPWVALPNGPGVYTATVTGSDYAVAAGCPVVSGAATTKLYYQTTADGLSNVTPLVAQCNFGPFATVDITVQVDGTPAGTKSSVYIGDLSTDLAAGATAAMKPQAGGDDVFARIAASTASNGNGPFLFFRSELDLDQAIGLSIESDSATPPETHSLSVTGVNAGDPLVIDTHYKTVLLQGSWPLLDTAVTPGSAQTYGTIDAHQRMDGDLTLVSAQVTRNTAGGLVYHREAGLALANPSDGIALDVPAELAAVPAPVIDSAADPRLTVSIPTASADGLETDYQAIAFTRDAQDSQRTMEVNVSPSRAAGSASVTITTPDLSHIAGWSSAMRLDPAQTLRWQVQRTSHTDAQLRDGYHTNLSSISSQFE